MIHSLSGQIINWKGWALRVNPNPLNIVKSCPCQIWYDGQDEDTFSLNVNKVIQWDDKGLLAAHVNNGVDAQRPTWDPTTGRVTFNAAAQTYLQSADFDTTLEQPNTIFVLYRIIGALGDTEMVFDGKNDRNAIFYTVNKFTVYAGTQKTNGATDANDNIHITEFNGVNSNYWINGNLKLNETFGIWGLNGITLGTNNLLTQNADVEIMEVFGYNCSLTEAERNRCELYLKKKWGLNY